MKICKYQLPCFLMLLLLVGCTPEAMKFNGLSNQVTVTTSELSGITQTTAVGGVEVGTSFSDQVLRKGVCWATTSQPTINNATASGGSGSGFVAVNLTNLNASTTYYVRAYAVTGQETIYGSIRTFSTPAYQASTVNTSSATTITQTTAVSGGTISAAGGGSISARGICWNTTGTPTISNSMTSDGTGTGSYSSTLTNLTPGTLYYVRAYATNQAGTTYGNQISFTTLPYQLASVTTASPYSITQTTAVSGGSASLSGAGSISSRGICWNTTGSPTTANDITSDGSGSGSFSSSMTNLSAGTTYYIRAYAISQAGIAYGSQVSFTTVGVSLATIGAPSIGSITQISASGTYTISSAGGGSVSSRGLCWNTTGSPTTSNSHTIDGSGTGSFSSNLTALSAGTTYYVRAYAVNQAGTAYSSQASFTTTAVQLATLTSASISSIAKTSATGTASVSSDGGGTVTSKGLCWSSTTSAPTISNSNYSANGSGTGTIAVSMTSLVTGTTYYVRPYATNAAGTSYGSVISFRTL